ncbi:MAG TPA: retroviral-like aspartic protease family protein [Caulobacteraceae bacterium]|nr:retroviral-like aspartic protease family protein [Caulobacteraceae bacterium]
MFASNRVATAALAAAMLLAPGAALADCKLLQMAEFHLDPHYGAPVMDGAINGHPIKILIDTGSSFSAVHSGAVQALHLNSYDTGERAYGIGGQAEVYKAHIDELKIGDFAKKNMDLLVTGDPRQAWDISLLLGADFLAQVDVEFDLPDHAVRLFRHVGCQPPQLVYWGAAYSQAKLLPWERDSPKLQAMAEVNGRPVLAELDSGFSITTIDATVASAAGGKPTGGAPDELRGVGPAAQTATAARFDSFALGDEKISNATLDTTRLRSDFEYMETGSLTPRRLDSSPSLFIGDDFFRAHRIYFDTADRLIMFSYAGGPVFQRRSAPPPPSSTPGAPPNR